MTCILENCQPWLQSLPPADPSELLFLDAAGHRVAVHVPVMIAASPLLKTILTDLMPPSYSLCSISIPDATYEVLQDVVCHRDGSLQ